METFLDASLYLYKRVCLSVRHAFVEKQGKSEWALLKLVPNRNSAGTVGVCPSVCWSVRWSSCNPFVMLSLFGLLGGKYGCVSSHVHFKYFFFITVIFFFSIAESTLCLVDPPLVACPTKTTAESKPAMRKRQCAPLKDNSEGKGDQSRW